MRDAPPPTLRTGRVEVTTRRLVVFAFLAALLATFLTDYRYAEVGIEEIDPMIRRVMDPAYLSNDFFTNATDEFGPRFFFARFIAAIATPGSLPFIYFALTLAVNSSIALISGLFASELFRSKIAGLFAIALVMGASAYHLGGAGQAHASEPNSYWLSFPFAISAVWAVTRARPLLAGLLAGLASLLHPSFGASVAGLIFAALAVGLWDRRRQEGTKVPVLAFAAGILLFAALLAVVVVPYAAGPRIPEDQLFEIMTLRMPHHLLPSTFSTSDWLKGGSFVVALIVVWRWLRQAHRLDRFATTVLLSMFAGLLLFFLAGYLFVEVWPWKPWFILIPYRSTSFFLWLGLVLIGSNAALRVTESARVGEGVALQASLLNPISAGLAHLAALIHERRRLSLPLLIAGAVVVVAVGVAFSDPRDVVQFALVNGLAIWFTLGPDRAWASVAGVIAPLALAGALLAFQTVSHTAGTLDRVGPEIFPSHVEGSEANIARAARDSTPVDSVILTPPTFGSFRVLSQRAIVVDMRTIPYQEDAMAEWMDRIFAVYGIPPAAEFESEDFGTGIGEELTGRYGDIDDASIAALCDLFPITHAVLFSETQTNYPVVEQNDTYRLVEVDDCA